MGDIGNQIHLSCLRWQGTFKLVRSTHFYPSNLVTALVVKLFVIAFSAYRGMRTHLSLVCTLHLWCNFDSPSGMSHRILSYLQRIPCLALFWCVIISGSI